MSGLTAHPSTYAQRKARLTAACTSGQGPFRLSKRTTSNLFRYGGRRASQARVIAAGDLNHVLGLDPQGRTLEVEGLITYEQVVAFTLPRGFLPTVTPELKHSGP